MSDWTYRACDGYARVCSALGIVRPDGTPGDVDAVLSYIALLQQRAARVHELESHAAADAWDGGAEYTQREAATRGMSWPSYAHAANPYRKKP